MNGNLAVQFANQMHVDVFSDANLTRLLESDDFALTRMYLRTVRNTNSTPQQLLYTTADNSVPITVGTFAYLYTLQKRGKRKL